MLVKNLLEKEGIEVAGAVHSCTVLIAHDTRPSGPRLADAAAAGVRCMGLQPQLLGLLTTPQLHWAVMKRNLDLPCDEPAYCAELAAAFEQLVAGTMVPAGALHVDCANGVGAPKLATLAPLLRRAGLELDLRNTGSGVLNDSCGSDYLHKDRQLPEGFGDLAHGTRCCSLDGDADRLMYFTPAAGTPGHALLLDGDRIATLAALLLRDLLAALPPNARDSTSLGIVQTAYANGSASQYVREQLGCAVAVTPTGVKYLHEAAHRFDLGVYFEANGHGTVLLSKKFLARMEQVGLRRKGVNNLANQSHSRSFYLLRHVPAAAGPQ